MASSAVVEQNDDESRTESFGRAVLRRFFRHRVAAASLVVLMALAAIAVFAPWIAPYDPYEVFPSFEAPPSVEHWLGTDQVGRDVLSRLIYGSRVSLLVGLGTVAVYVAIGAVLGMVAGYAGRWVDSLIMRFTDVVMSFPYFMVILVFVSVLGPSTLNVILVLGLLGWPDIARLIRGSILSAKNTDYVRAAVALGLPHTRIAVFHIMPNIIAPVLVNATFGVSNAILMESALSFLGMGVQPPLASWGNMLTDAQSLTILSSKPWLWLPPGIMILVTVLAINFVGDGLRDALDPKKVR